MFEETGSEIVQTKGRITNLEKRVKELEVEVATIPTVGYHRPRYLRTKRELKSVREALAAEQENLAGLLALGETEVEVEQIMSPEQLADFKKFEAEQEAERKERHKREREAERRREGFKVIEGGKD